MDILLYLLPLALGLGLIGLVGFLWSLKSHQYDDLDGAAHRILFEDEGEHGPKSTPGIKIPDERPQD